jgi:uncharacterized protein (UPF0332 family)
VNNADLMLKATTALSSAELLLQAGDTDEACNRSYYAMFDASRAVLLTMGAVEDLSSVKTHSGLITAFGLHVVKPGMVLPELGKSLNKVEDLRLVADYRGDEVTDEQAQWALEQAHTFVLEMQRLIERLSAAA